MRDSYVQNFPLLDLLGDAGELIFSIKFNFLNLIYFVRFCNAPYDREMISNIILKAEGQLQEISLNPSVKQYETFIRKHLRTLHLKHYLNLTGEDFRKIFLFICRFNFSSKKYHRIVCKRAQIDKGSLSENY